MNADLTSTAWPALPYVKLRPTADTLQLWTQIAGKIALARTPWTNHAWHVTLKLSARGLATPLIPIGASALQLEFDLVNQQLVLRTTDGGERRLPLGPGSVAEFYAATMGALESLGAATRIVATPNELADAVSFPQDHAARTYEPEIAQALWRALVHIERVFGRFRSRFLGKCSPIHFFWGGADLAVTRFSGRQAPLHPGGVPHLPDNVTREAYSHEVSSAGFWPGDERAPEPSFYSYAYPTPPGFSQAPLTPAGARFDDSLGEFLLPYELVRRAADPDGTLLAFLQSTYEAAANLGGWDRAALDCEEGSLGRPRDLF
jgi:hypothetical protein